MPILENQQLTPREHMIMEAEREEAKFAREHAVTIKQLEIELQREKNSAQIELRRLEAKWSSLLSLPSLLIRLPLLLLLGIGYIVSVIRKQEPSKSFWAYIK